MMSELRGCPLHGPDSGRSFGTRSGYELGRCPQCGLVYLSRRERSINRQFFQDSAPSRATSHRDAIEYWSFPDFYHKYKHIFEHFFQERLNRLYAIHPSLESLLDIGCGYGFFVEYASRFLPRAEGVDLNETVVREAREAGRSVRCVAAESLAGFSSYDAVVMCDILEHVEEPLKVLATAYHLLHPGGVLYVQVPNLVGLKFPLGHGWGLPHHIWQFGPRSLEAMLRTTGFIPHSYTTGVLGIIGVLEKGGPSLRKRLEWWIARNFNCGNRLQYIAIKPE